MRTIQTFILRLLVDASHLEGMRGALQAMDEQKQTLPFRNETELIAVIRQLSAEQCEDNPGLNDDEMAGKKY